MKLTGMTVTEFINTAASDAPVPGGGSAAALEGAAGAALISMVAALTIGRQKYAAVQELAEDTKKKADDLKDRFMQLVDRDAETFGAVSAVYAMPKETDEQKAARREALQPALKGCTEVPLELMALSAEALELLESVTGKLSSNAASDIGCAAASLRSAAQSAWLNVLINIGSIRDEEFDAAAREKGSRLLEKSLRLADSVYDEVVGSLDK